MSRKLSLRIVGPQNKPNTGPTNSTGIDGGLLSIMLDNIIYNDDTRLEQRIIDKLKIYTNLLLIHGILIMPDS